jgi:hypothetical protein
VHAVKACIWCFIGVLVLSFNEIAYSSKRKKKLEDIIV